MKYIIPGWVHNPGAHCASTAISDAMTFHGHELSEAMCFGIGCGLGFAYIEGDFVSPTRLTQVRSRHLEPRFFENIGRPFNWETDPDPAHALAVVKEYIQARVPVLLRADLAYLPYYNSKTHFAGHVILLWGFDDESETAYVADTGFEGCQQVPYSELAKARYGGMGYMKNTGEHYPVEAGEPIPDLVPILKKALVQQEEDLKGLELDMPALFGFKAMERAAEAMPSWGEVQDWKWAARWFYQVIERRGTGGGAFRLLYSRFLEEAGRLDPLLAKAAPAPEMKKIADKWTELAFFLKEISEGNDPSPLARAGRLLAEIKKREEDFFARAASALNPKNSVVN